MDALFLAFFMSCAPIPGWIPWRQTEMYRIASCHQHLLGVRPAIVTVPETDTCPGTLRNASLGIWHQVQKRAAGDGVIGIGGFFFRCCPCKSIVSESEVSAVLTSPGIQVILLALCHRKLCFVFACVCCLKIVQVCSNCNNHCAIFRAVRKTSMPIKLFYPHSDSSCLCSRAGTRFAQGK